MPRVLVPLAAGFEEIEAMTIIDLLRRAGITVVSAGLNPGPIRASHATMHLPDMDLDHALQQEYDMVVLPGGLPGSDHLANDARIIALLRRMAEKGLFTAAICAAPKALVAAGLLTGKRATAYPGVLESLGITNSALPVVSDGKIITSRGPGTAIDFVLTLIEQLTDRKMRDQVEANLQR